MIVVAKKYICVVTKLNTVIHLFQKIVGKNNVCNFNTRRKIEHAIILGHFVVPASEFVDGLAFG